MAHKILVVDDDKNLRLVLRAHLTRAGYQVVTASDGREALSMAFQERPDLIILDVMMPHMDGWEVCRRIRAMSDIPIIMLTARAESKDVVKGLHLGADDYLDKPFDGKELQARVQSVLRRANASSGKTKEAYRDGYLTIDLDQRRVTVAGEPVDLSPTEFNILALLVESRGRVQTYQRILEEVWGPGYTEEADYVRTYMWHLRRKIEPEPKRPRYLINDFGVGYHFEPQP